MLFRSRREKEKEEMIEKMPSMKEHLDYQDTRKDWIRWKDVVKDYKGIEIRKIGRASCRERV